MTTNGTSERVFDEVQIGKGIRPVAQHGYVTVDDGVLNLLGSDRHLIESAPVERVKASKARFSGGMTLAMRVNGSRYNVSPKYGDRAGKLVRPGRPEAVEQAAEELLELIEAGGGRVD
ncbi:hypothetical protein [Streptomyces sp. RFCAC02]|uniref:hypothetical protein n=1 Tax=Streptomyces sp. RFCAC02 TaxID=2499143 RepID=UPI00102287B2|nr:hypothetical protein [Streptomyces sp. RFCAC02]